MLMQCERACCDFWGDQAENNCDLTEEIQGNHHNLKQNSTEKENFFISKERKKLFASKVSGSQPLFGKRRLRAVNSQKLTTVCKKANKESLNKNLHKKPCFLNKEAQKNLSKVFWSTTPRSMGNQKRLGDNSRHPFEAFF